MSTFFYWFGVIVFTLLMLLIGGFGGLAIWEEARWFSPWRRRLLNGWLGFKIVVLRQPLLRSRQVCRNIIHLSRRGGYWGSDWWERNLAARIIHDSRRAGFPTQDA